MSTARATRKTPLTCFPTLKSSSYFLCFPPREGQFTHSLGSFCFFCGRKGDQPSGLLGDVVSVVDRLDHLPAEKNYCFSEKISDIFMFVYRAAARQTQTLQRKMLARRQVTCAADHKHCCSLCSLPCGIFFYVTVHSCAQADVIGEPPSLLGSQLLLHQATLWAKVGENMNNSGL